MKLKSISRAVLSLFFIAAGVNHFLSAPIYVAVMPNHIPWPWAMVYLSGVAEVVLGAGVLVSRVRWWAKWGLVALLIAVFPANIAMALHGFRSVPSWILWARLPLQAVLIAWVYWSCRAESAVGVGGTRPEGPVSLSKHRIPHQH